MACQTDVTTPALHPCSEICKAAALLDPFVSSTVGLATLQCLTSSVVAPCCSDGGAGRPGVAPAPAASCCQGGAAEGTGQCVANVGHDEILKLGLQPPLHNLLLVEAKTIAFKLAHDDLDVGLSCGTREGDDGQHVCDLG
ncbi:hypothetical protein HaLaN_14392, partial [Haematococcus lacustris]